jgi:hypothetical protein
VVFIHHCLEFRAIRELLKSSENPRKSWSHAVSGDSHRTGGSLRFRLIAATHAASGLVAKTTVHVANAAFRPGKGYCRKCKVRLLRCGPPGVRLKNSLHWYDYRRVRWSQESNSNSPKVASPPCGRALCPKHPVGSVIPTSAPVRLHELDERKSMEGEVNSFEPAEGRFPIVRQGPVLNILWTWGPTSVPARLREVDEPTSPERRVTQFGGLPDRRAGAVTTKPRWSGRATLQPKQGHLCGMFMLTTGFGDANGLGTF